MKCFVFLDGELIDQREVTTAFSILWVKPKVLTPDCIIFIQNKGKAAKWFDYQMYELLIESIPKEYLLTVLKLL